MLCRVVVVVVRGKAGGATKKNPTSITRLLHSTIGNRYSIQWQLEPDGIMRDSRRSWV